MITSCLSVATSTPQDFLDLISSAEIFCARYHSVECCEKIPNSLSNNHDGGKHATSDPFFFLRVDLSLLCGFHPVLGRLALCEPHSLDYIFSRAISNVINKNNNDIISNRLLVSIIVVPQRTILPSSSSSACKNNDNCTNIQDGIDFLSFVATQATAERISLEEKMLDFFETDDDESEEENNNAGHRHESSHRKNYFDDDYYFDLHSLDDDEDDNDKTNFIKCNEKLHHHHDRQIANLPCFDVKNYLNLVCRINVPLTAIQPASFPSASSLINQNNNHLRDVLSNKELLFADEIQENRRRFSNNRNNVHENANNNVDATSSSSSALHDALDDGRQGVDFFSTSFCSVGESLFSPLLTLGRVPCSTVHVTGVISRIFAVPRPNGELDFIPLIKVHPSSSSCNNNNNFDFSIPEIDVVMFPVLFQDFLKESCCRGVEDFMSDFSHDDTNKNILNPNDFLIEMDKTFFSSPKNSSNKNNNNNNFGKTQSSTSKNSSNSSSSSSSVPKALIGRVVDIVGRVGFLNSSTEIVAKHCFSSSQSSTMNSKINNDDDSNQSVFFKDLLASAFSTSNNSNSNNSNTNNFLAQTYQDNWNPVIYGLSCVFVSDIVEEQQNDNEISASNIQRQENGIEDEIAKFVNDDIFLMTTSANHFNCDDLISSCSTPFMGNIFGTNSQNNYYFNDTHSKGSFLRSSSTSSVGSCFSSFSTTTATTSSNGCPRFIKSQIKILKQKRREIISSYLQDEFINPFLMDGRNTDFCCMLEQEFFDLFSEVYFSSLLLASSNGSTLSWNEENTLDDDPEFLLRISSKFSTFLTSLHPSVWIAGFLSKLVAEEIIGSSIRILVVATNAQKIENDSNNNNNNNAKSLIYELLLSLSGSPSIHLLDQTSLPLFSEDGDVVTPSCSSSAITLPLLNYRRRYTYIDAFFAGHLGRTQFGRVNVIPDLNKLSENQLNDILSGIIIAGSKASNNENDDDGNAMEICQFRKLTMMIVQSSPPSSSCNETKFHQRLEKKIHLKKSQNDDDDSANDSSFDNNCLKTPSPFFCQNLIHRDEDGEENIFGGDDRLDHHHNFNGDDESLFWSPSTASSLQSKNNLFASNKTIKKRIVSVVTQEELQHGNWTYSCHAPSNHSVFCFACASNGNNEHSLQLLRRNFDIFVCLHNHHSKTPLVSPGIEDEWNSLVFENCFSNRCGNNNNNNNNNNNEINLNHKFVTSLKRNVLLFGRNCCNDSGNKNNPSRALLSFDSLFSPSVAQSFLENNKNDNNLLLLQHYRRIIEAIIETFASKYVDDEEATNNNEKIISRIIEKVRRLICLHHHLRTTTATKVYSAKHEKSKILPQKYFAQLLVDTIISISLIVVSDNDSNNNSENRNSIINPSNNILHFLHHQIQVGPFQFQQEQEEKYHRRGESMMFFDVSHNDDDSNNNRNNDALFSKFLLHKILKRGRIIEIIRGMMLDLKRAASK